MMNDLRKNVPDFNNRGKLDDYLVKVLRKEANDKSGLVYGMGHAIYTLSDPRAKVLKSMAKKLAESKDLVDDFLLCDYIERRTPELYAEVHGVEKPMPANVDLYSGFVSDALGIPTTIATPLFATARSVRLVRSPYRGADFRRRTDASGLQICAAASGLMYRSASGFLLRRSVQKNRKSITTDRYLKTVRCILYSNI